MEDLDSLLEDLGRGKSTSTAKKQRPPSSRVDLNELEDLMEDLAAPTSKPMPEPTPAFTSYSAPTPAPAPTSSSTSSASNSNGSTSDGGDDLDALMESLNAASRSSKRVSSSPSAASSNSSSSYTPSSRPASIAITPSPPPPEPPKPTPTYSAPSSSSSSYSAPRSSMPPASKASSSSGGAVKKGDDLDALLNNLTSQMNTIDSENPASRGTCSTCRQPILGEIIQALGRSYHPEHFVCGNCREPLGTRNFFEQNGAAHCEKCFQELYCPKCAHCDKPVLDRCITALGKKWHTDHFICTQCLKPFGTGNFFERDGRPYCEADFYALYAPKCGGCNEPIRGDCINALGTQWHPEHFACTYCQKSFAGGSFFEFAGKPYCEIHYHQQTGSLCAGCGKPITGRCVNALEKKWHPEHFVCAFCMNALAGGSFTEHNGKAYCRECHGKLFPSH